MISILGLHPNTYHWNGVGLCLPQQTGSCSRAGFTPSSSLGTRVLVVSRTMSHFPDKLRPGELTWGPSPLWYLSLFFLDMSLGQDVFGRGQGKVLPVNLGPCEIFRTGISFSGSVRGNALFVLDLDKDDNDSFFLFFSNYLLIVYDGHRHRRCDSR